MHGDQPLLLIVDDPALKLELLRELALRRPARDRTQPPGHYQVSIARNPAEAVRRLGNGFPPAHGDAATLIVFDAATLGADPPGPPALARAVSELAERGFVILLLDPDHAHPEPALPADSLSALVARGRVDVVPRGTASVPLLLALLERHVAAAASREPASGSWEVFGELLRHEMNNPLTGILGNAELLLARRDHLPPADVERLKTIAEMAVRLRETVRRLSNAWEGCMLHGGEMEVKLRV